MDEIVVINLFGEEFRFAPDDQVKNPERVANHLTKYIGQAEDLFRRNRSSQNKVAILLLAAMNMSKDFHELMEKNASLEKEIERRIDNLAGKIDKEIEMPELGRKKGR